MDAVESEFLLTEYRELRAHVGRLLDTITQTERFAVLGAAGAAAFSVSNLTGEFAASRVFISALPFVIVSLAGLRCLTLYFVMRAALSYLDRVEDKFLSEPDLGFQRQFGRKGPLNRYVEVVSGSYWVLAVCASVLFWLLVN